MLKLLHLLPNLIGDFDTMTALRRLVVFCGERRDTENVITLLVSEEKQFLTVNADKDCWWQRPLRYGVEPALDQVQWERVAEQADQMLATSAGGDDDCIVVVWASIAAVAECTATCLYADASFRPSAFRNNFPHEFYVLQ